MPLCKVYLEINIITLKQQCKLPQSKGSLYYHVQLETENKEKCHLYNTYASALWNIWLERNARIFNEFMRS